MQNQLVRIPTRATDLVDQGELARWRTRCEELVQEAAELPAIETLDQVTMARAQLTKIKVASEDLEKDRGELSKPLTRLAREINALVKPFADQLAQAAETITAKVEAYRAAQRKAELQRQRDEQAAAAERERVANEEAARLRREAVAEHDPDKMAAATEIARAAAEDAKTLPSVEIVQPKTIVTEAGKFTERVTWKVEVTDLAQLVAWVASRRGDSYALSLVEPNMRSLNRIKPRGREVPLEIPGVRFFQDSSLV